jgi:putative endonuclease
VQAHREKLVPGFAARYSVTRLVYYETVDDRDAALAREKQIKAGSRAKKIVLIRLALLCSGSQMACGVSFSPERA